MKIIIIGRTEPLYQTALELRKEGHRIEGIITAKAAPEYKIMEKDFKGLAMDLEVPYFCCNNLSEEEIFNFIKEAKPDIGVSTNWVSLIKENVLSCFRLGVLNAHLGDLPRYRGNACPNWAILNGEEEIVLSVHIMEGNLLDCGRIVYQDRYPLTPDTYITHIHDWGKKTIPKAFVESVKRLSLDPTSMIKYADPNDPTAFRCYPRQPGDGLINWKKSAEEICRLVRASAEPFAGAFTYYHGEKIIIWKARKSQDGEKYLAVPGQICGVDRQNSGTVTVITGAGKLIIDKMGYENRAIFEPANIIRSIRDRLG